MRTPIIVLLDFNPSLKHVAYSRSSTASPMCSCRIPEETSQTFYSIPGIWIQENCQQPTSTCMTKMTVLN